MKHVLGAAFALALAVTITPAGDAAAEKLKFAHSTWVGYGPLYIAQEKGYFKDEGLDVELIVIEDTKVRIPALLAGKIDAMATTIDTPLAYLSETQQFRYIFAIDDSKGGDGIVANKDIQTIADLKGKKIAYSEGSVSHFYLATLLKRAGLTLADVESVNMSAGDAGAAFVTGKVDAAVTWEPWLTRGRQAEHGRLLVDSSTSPGLITDIAITTPERLAARRDDFKALVRAWYRAVDFVKSNPKEADEIMARGVGGWLKKPEVFAETRSGIVFYDEAMNRSFIGTADNPGAMIDTIQGAIDLWYELGRMKLRPEPAALIDFGIVNQ
jgi:NitT/TauT family transport system substrate-binding protein